MFNYKSKLETFDAKKVKHIQNTQTINMSETSDFPRG